MKETHDRGSHVCKKLKSHTVIKSVTTIQTINLRCFGDNSELQNGESAHPNHYGFVKARPQGSPSVYQQLLSIVLLPDLGVLIQIYAADDPSTFYHF
jgi:hypothetical protein